MTMPLTDTIVNFCQMVPICIDSNEYFVSILEDNFIFGEM